MEGDNVQETNKRIVLAYAEAFSRGDMAALHQVFSETAQIHGVLGWGGLDEVVPIWEMLHAAFGFQLHVEEMVAQGNIVVARFLERGTSVGPFRGQAATGKSSEVVAIEWFVLEGGRIRRRWGVRDSASHFKQMGLALG